MKNTKYVAYYRVSTKKQGVSGLGLDAQKAAVLAFLKGQMEPEIKSREAGVSLPGPTTPKSPKGTRTIPPKSKSIPFQEYTEVESGKRTKNRPQLAKAIQSCRIFGAVLVIAKLDRLSRNAHFLLGLQEAGIDFVCADMPFANRLTIGVMALVAEEEGKAISTRTKDALAAARARGVRLGGYRGAVITPEISALGVQAVKERSRNKARDIAPIISEIQANGAVSLRAIAQGLNDRGVPAPRGGLWQAKSVQRVLDRI